MSSMTELFYNIRYECKKKENESYFSGRNDGKICGWIWDGIMCWPSTKAGVELTLPCPEYFGYNSKTNATKRCTENGTWFVHEEYNKTWTNFTQCEKLIDKDTAKVDFPIDLENLTIYYYWFPKIKTINYIGYSLSISTLLIAIAIFLYFRKLQCARNRLHLHLFFSFFLKATMFVVKEFLFYDGTALPNDIVFSPEGTYVKEHIFWFCKAFTSFGLYVVMTNYMLILMEGIYLHNLLFLSLYSEKNDIKYYTLFGWCVPVCFVVPSVVLKILYEDEYCWTVHKNKSLQLIIHIPIVISTLINFILFIKIIHILLVKLNSIYIQQRKIKYRRLIRSTMILMPLFGVPYMFSILTWYAAAQNIQYEIMWMAFDQTFTSFQGFSVAVLYCLLNSEVRMELKKVLLEKLGITHENLQVNTSCNNKNNGTVMALASSERRSTQ